MRTLAWHETLELHEIMAATTYYLYKLKTNLKNITDEGLKELYKASINTFENNLRDILKFMSNITIGERDAASDKLASEMSAEDLLTATKVLTKMYAHALTETATPDLNNMFVKQLVLINTLHSQIFNYLSKEGQYSAYNINKLIENDAKKAMDVLKMPY
ncbi:spore coat protein [Bacillus sp. AFS041924]|uniref:spore coat protein n=1 Tax=Bacillus sp. AFS041924 TaxID=2033503 RepID=UPI000BFC9F75|nr:spore coat protein [Bacillus sp. AFS041924]PGS46133.1 spore coat protein [Bacillus sp. AFS041924]